jgi:PPOX class probable F420-dependent enzyme
VANLTSEQADFVRKPHIAVLATIGDDGQPHAVPMWYWYDGSAFVMVTRRGSHKHRNLERQPRAQLVIDAKERPYYALMIGCGAAITSDAPDLMRSRIAARYLAEPELTTYLESRRGGDAVVLHLDPLEVKVYGRPPSA